MSVLRNAAVGIVAAALAAGAALAAPSATAAPTARSTAGLHAKLPTGKLATGTTTYGAGYFTYPGGSNGVASASVTFLMPAFSCNRTDDQEWLLPGIWVYGTGGSLSQQVDVNFNCNSGTKFQAGIICIGGTCDQTLTVSPGDRIRASIAYTSTATIGTLRNLTTGVTTQVTGGAITGDYTVFIGDEGPSLFLSGQIKKVPTFKKVPFSAASVNGQSIDDWAGVRYNLKTQTRVQIAAGPTADDGTSFVTNFLHNN